MCTCNSAIINPCCLTSLDSVTATMSMAARVFFQFVPAKATSFSGTYVRTRPWRLSNTALASKLAIAAHSLSPLTVTLTKADSRRSSEHSTNRRACKPAIIPRQGPAPISGCTLQSFTLRRKHNPFFCQTYLILREGPAAVAGRRRHQRSSPPSGLAVARSGFVWSRDPHALPSRRAAWAVMTRGSHWPLAHAVRFFHRE
ncbi:hypothetical protein BD413DRAFT_567821 [Trametes elegans]|nr:hypothetical protein BD413DRAFT_567821 [Trametes elegans]